MEEKAGGMLGPVTTVAKAEVRSPPDADHEINALVGQIAIVSAHIEHALDALIWCLMKIRPELAACITSELSGFPARCAVVKKMLEADQASDELMIKWKDLGGNAFSKAIGIRNRAIHDPWFVGADEGQVKKKPERSAAFGYEATERANVVGNIDLLRNLLSDVQGFRSDVRAWQQTSR